MGKCWILVPLLEHKTISVSGYWVGEVKVSLEKFSHTGLLISACHGYFSSDQLSIFSRLRAELSALRRRGVVKASHAPGGAAQWAADPARSCGRCKAELGRIINRGAVCRYNSIQIDNILWSGSTGKQLWAFVFPKNCFHFGKISFSCMGFYFQDTHIRTYRSHDLSCPTRS